MKIPNAIFALASLSLIVILYIVLINSSVIAWFITCIITPIIWIIQIPIIGIWVITITGILTYTLLVGIPSTSWYRNEKRVAITLMIIVSLGFLILKHKGDVFLTLCLVSIIHPTIQIIRMELMSTLKAMKKLGKGEYHENN